MRKRIEEELELLRRVFPGTNHAERSGEDWFLIPEYRIPPGWRVGDTPAISVPVAFKIGAAYPTGEPYGFVTPLGINYQGAPPQNTGSPVDCPFDGSWQHFSWSPDGTWRATADVSKGSNLLTWARSFFKRLQEGA